MSYGNQGKDKMKVKLIVEGGAMKPGPAVAQQLGPMGINLGKVIDNVNKATSGFKGTKVPVEIDVNPKTKEFTIEVFSPPVAELIKKEMNLEKASGETGKTYVGNIAFETVLGIAMTKQANLLAKTLKSAVRLVLGTCTSMGVLIDNKSPIEVGREVENGKYDAEINQEKTEASEDKKKELERFWKELKAKQEKTKKALEEAKAAEAEKKEEAAKATAVATPVVGTSKEAEKKAPAAKEAPKKEEKKK